MHRGRGGIGSRRFPVSTRIRIDPLAERVALSKQAEKLADRFNEHVSSARDTFDRTTFTLDYIRNNFVNLLNDYDRSVRDLLFTLKDQIYDRTVPIEQIRNDVVTSFQEIQTLVGQIISFQIQCLAWQMDALKRKKVNVTALSFINELLS